jgi:hypothetical protein
LVNSQPPPSANPSTAATVGTSEYFQACVAAWNCSTTPSIFSNRPAITTSATFNLRAAFNTADSASRRNFFIMPANADGFASLFGRAEGPDKFAPTENGGSACQMMRPL